MQTPLTFFFAFVVVLALIGLAAWLVRRFAGNRLGANANRGRMPRLAVIDAAAVDGRRRLVLVRRDNVEHLLMIGGPSDIVVEQNIVRAMPARDQAPPRPSVGGAELPPRVALPDAGNWSDSDAAPDHPEPAMPEPPPRPNRPSFADEVRRPAPALSERRSDPLAGFTPEPMSRTDIRETAPPGRHPRAASRSFPVPRGRSSRQRRLRSAPRNVPRLRRRLRLRLRFRRPTRISPRWRSGWKQPFGARPAIRPSPVSALLQWRPSHRQAGPGRSQMAPPVTPPSPKSGFENLEDEMASLLGRPKNLS